MKYIKTLKIDIDKKNFEVIPSVQYDSNTRFLHIQLLNESTPFNITGCSVVLSGTKEDGNPIFNSCDIINSEIGFIQAEVTEQMNAIPGYIDCEIKIYDGEGVLTSKKFTIKVTASQTSKGVVSSDEFTALTKALGTVQDVDNRFDNVNTRISNIIANNGDGNKDSEIIDARNGANSLRDRLEPIDRYGYAVENGTIAGEPVQINSATLDRVIAWGVSVKPNCDTIKNIAIQKVNNIYTWEEDLTINVYETANIDLATVRNSTPIITKVLSKEVLNNSQAMSDIRVSLDSAYKIKEDMYYTIIAKHSKPKLPLMQVGWHNNMPGSPVGIVYDEFKCGWYISPEGELYKSSPITYGLYTSIEGVGFKKGVKVSGYQVPEHSQEIRKLKDSVTELETDLYINGRKYTKGVQASYTCGNINVDKVPSARGWGVSLKNLSGTFTGCILQKSLDTLITDDLTVRIFEGEKLTPSPTSGTLLYETVVPKGDYNIIPKGKEFLINITEPIVADPTKIYSVLVTNASGVINVAQCGTWDGKDFPVSSKWCGGHWYNGIWGYTSPNIYGLYCAFVSDTSKYLPIFEGGQVPELDDRLVELEKLKLGEFKNSLNSKLLSNGDVDISDCVYNGTKYFGHNSHSLGYGWATILKGLDIDSAKYVSVIKAHTKAITGDISVKIYSMDSFKGAAHSSNSLSVAENKKLIQSVTISSTAWNNTPYGEELTVELPEFMQIDSTKKYGVTLFNTSFDKVPVAQTGYIEAGDYKGDYRNEYFETGLWHSTTAENGGTDNLEYFKLTGGNYGAYVKLSKTNIPEYKVKINPKQIPEHDKGLKQVKSDIEEISKDLEELKTKGSLATDVYGLAHLLSRDNPLVTNCPNFLDKWLRMDKDLYVVMTGDSILAHQYSIEKSLPSVAEVPPLCDRMAVGGHIWDIVKKGSPQYRRFDYGKNSLIGNWCDRWKDGDNAFFTESGNFETYYVSGNNSQSAYDNQNSLPRVTTKITQRDCPISNFGNWDYERWIPRRVATNAHSFIKFKIPVGYSKFDFIYDTNAQADDNVTINVTIGGAGKVKVATDRNKADFVEADGYVFSQKETNSGDGYDTANVTKRLFFTKPIDEEIEIRIMKSSDTSKYLFYWGVTYWGTANEPYACHLVNTARGSSRLGNIYGERNHRFKGVVENPDLVITELTLINNSSSTTNPSGMLSDYGKINTFLSSNSIERFYLLPNAHRDRLLPPYTTFWDSAKAQLIKDGEAYLDIQKCMYKHWQSLYPNGEKTWKDYFLDLMYDRSCHPNDKGNKYFRYMLEPVFDLL